MILMSVAPENIRRKGLRMERRLILAVCLLVLVGLAGGCGKKRETANDGKPIVFDAGKDEGGRSR